MQPIGKRRRCETFLTDPRGSYTKMVTLDSLEMPIRDKIENAKWTHPKLSEFLKASYPGRRGFSVTSIERFCRLKEIHKTSHPTSNTSNHNANVRHVTKTRIL